MHLECVTNHTFMVDARHSGMGPLFWEILDDDLNLDFIYFSDQGFENFISRCFFHLVMNSSVTANASKKLHQMQKGSMTHQSYFHDGMCDKFFCYGPSILGDLDMMN